MSAALSAPLPWLMGAVDKLDGAWRQGRWPHALLIHGAAGLGKRRLAEWIAQALLCDANDTLRGCGACASCRLFAANTHPDLLRIVPEEDKQSISIDQIREASASLSLTSFRRGYKVALIEPAHQMTIAAANSLLKTLEEPAPRTMLILLTSKPSGLPATIRSRCQHLALRAPAETEALAWLQREGSQVPAAVLRFARGAPLRALELAKGRYATLAGETQTALDALLSARADVTQIAKQWNDDDLLDRLLCLDDWLEQRIRALVYQTADPVTGAVLPSDAPTLNISRMFVVLDRVRELRSILGRTALQRELAIEAVLLALLDTFAPRPV